MTKETKKTLILTTLVCLIPIIAGVFLYSRLPERIVTHWDAAGNPNGWSSRFVGVFVFPGILLILNLLFPFLLKTDPKYHNISEKTKNLIQWILPMTELFASGITLASAMGAEMRVEIYAPMFMGLIFIITGNYMPKISQSYTVGIKIPWTLDDEENWDKTHRFSGFLWVISGILMIAGAFFRQRMLIFSILLGLSVLLPVAYSFILFLKKKRN